MPLNEHLPVKVTIVVEVDGHTLRFEEIGDARGSRHHGRDPRSEGYAAKPSDTLEQSVRGCVDTGIARATQRAMKLVTRAYPVHGDADAGHPDALALP